MKVQQWRVVFFGGCGSVSLGVIDPSGLAKPSPGYEDSRITHHR